MSSASDNEISFEMTRMPPGEMQRDENFLLQLTLSFQSDYHGDTQLKGVKVSRIQLRTSCIVKIEYL